MVVADDPTGTGAKANDDFCPKLAAMLEGQRLGRPATMGTTSIQAPMGGSWGGKKWRWLWDFKLCKLGHGASVTS
jgi:hypothetical protein